MTPIIKIIVSIGWFSFVLMSGIQAQTSMSHDIDRVKSLQEGTLKISFLDTLTERMVDENHPDRVVFLNELIGLAKKYENYDMAAIKTRYVAQELLFSNQPDSALYVVEDMLKEQGRFKNGKSKALLLLKRGSALYHKENLFSAVQDYDEAAQLFKDTGDSIYQADALYFSGQVSSDLKNFVEAVDKYTKAHGLYESLKDSTYVSYVLSDLANIYASNDFLDEANVQRHRIIEIALKQKNYLAVANNYYNIGGAYFRLGDFERMDFYFQKALSYMGTTNDFANQMLLSSIYIDQGSLYIEQNKYEAAQRRFRQVDSLDKLQGLTQFSKTKLAIAKARFDFSKGNLNKALQYLEELVNQNTINRDQQLQIHELSSSIYELKKNYAQALYHSRRYHEIKDSAYNSIKSNTLLYHQSRFESEQKESEIYQQRTTIELLEKNKEVAFGKRKFLASLLISVILASIIFVYVLWFLGNRKRKELAMSLKMKKKELDAYTRRLLKKSMEHEKLLKQFKNFTMSSSESTEELETLQTLSHTKILTNEDWEKFKQKFISVYPFFFVKLKSKGIILTKSEERLLALEKLQLQTSEVANILAISSNSVLTARYRLKKKLALAKEESLMDYLNS